eukprot:COSAG02_NODE_141_length_34311_cov_54.733135_19_plen_296_part_00
MPHRASESTWPDKRREREASICRDLVRLCSLRDRFSFSFSPLPLPSLCVGLCASSFLVPCKGVPNEPANRLGRPLPPPLPSGHCPQTALYRLDTARRLRSTVWTLPADCALPSGHCPQTALYRLDTARRLRSTVWTLPAALYRLDTDRDCALPSGHCPQTALSFSPLPLPSLCVGLCASSFLVPCKGVPNEPANRLGRLTSPTAPPSTVWTLPTDCALPSGHCPQTALYRLDTALYRLDTAHRLSSVGPGIKWWFKPPNSKCCARAAPKLCGEMREDVVGLWTGFQRGPRATFRI